MAPLHAPDAGKNKTAAIAGPRDLIGKLDWEIQALDRAWHQSPIIQSYHVFNCAVTAWQLCDWTWNAMDANQQAAIKAAVPAAKLPLQRFVQQERDELRICRQIATGMKHVEVDQHPDAGVTAVAEKSVEIFQSTTDPEQFKLLHGHGVFVWDGGKPWLAINVFHGAYSYWLSFLDQRAIDVR